jgi:hypothetical protein
MAPRATQTNKFDPARPWIDPIGGLGDCLWLSSVLFDLWKTSGRSFNLCRKEPYGSFLRGHPALASISVPPLHFPTLKVDYWSPESGGAEISRPYQSLSRMFGLKTPREENLWAPISDEEIAAVRAFPIGERYIIIAPTSVSPRKMWAFKKWDRLVQRIRETTNLPILQIGASNDPRVSGALHLCGLTSPRQVMALMTRAALVVAVDAFPLHAAAWAKVPTIALWGPTRPEVFGHADQENIQAGSSCPASCFIPFQSDSYLSPCDFKEGACLDRIDADCVFEKVVKFL